MPVSLASMQVDVTNRLGVLATSTPTGIAQLDSWILGGFRSGTLFVLTGAPGLGKSSLLLLLAYMAARTRAAIMYASAVLDETEIVARLAARALYREYPDSETPYGAIWSGEAWQDEHTRVAVATSVNVAIRKVGQLFHLYRARTTDTALDLGAAAAHLWGRHERVVLFIDGVESLGASATADPARASACHGDWGTRLTQVGYELQHLAEGGCAIVVTVESDHVSRLLPSATTVAELVPARKALENLSPRDKVLGARGVDLVVTKNQIGPRGVIPLKFVAGGAVFEELVDRGPHE